MRALLSIGAVRHGGLKAVVLVHDFREEHIANHAIARAGKMRMISLSETCLHPLVDRSRTAHARAPVPKRAAGIKCDLPLNLDHLVEMWEGTAPTVPKPVLAIGRSDQENTREWGSGAQPADHFDQ